MNVSDTPILDQTISDWQRKRNENRQKWQCRILEHLTQGALLQTILQELIDGVEEELPGSIASIMLLDEHKMHLHLPVGTNLPQFYVEAIDGMEIGPEVGSCGRAAYIGEKVLVEDIRTSPYWKNYREIADKAELVACWSEPILSENGEVLGTLAAYYKTPKLPTDQELKRLVDAAHWAGITIHNIKQREQLQKMSLAVEQSPADIVITDPMGNITYVNKKFTEVSGYEYDEVIGKNPRILKTGLTPPEVYGQLWKTIKAGKVWSGEFVNRRKNGQHYWEKAIINPILNESGNITHFLAIKEDITDFKKSQQELQLAKEMAESANRVKSTFIANISHEIRTPINAIMGFAELLLQDQSVSSTQRQHLETIGRSSEHLLGLIKDVLEISKIEAGKSTVNAVSFSPALVLHDVGDMFQLKIREKGLGLSISVPKELPEVIITDKQKFRQILINLISNAVKFTQTGEVRVCMGSYQDGSHPEIMHIFADVEDTGPGIEEEDFEKLFGVFTQTEAGAAAGGTGLGLSISRNYARLLGGDITVNSQLGKGSCFRVEILSKVASTERMNESFESSAAAKLSGQASNHELLTTGATQDGVIPGTRFKSFADSALTGKIDQIALNNHLVRLPQDIIDHLYRSADSADHYELIRWIEKVEVISPAFAAYLWSLSRHFEYGMLIEAIGMKDAPVDQDSGFTRSMPEILIVDDIPDNLNLLCDMLKDDDYLIRPAISGKDALQLARRYPPDLILLDITMPEMTGFEVMDRIKQSPMLVEVPVIFISALSETEDKVRAFDAGGVDYITKPFKSQEVKARISTVLRIQMLQRELKEHNNNLNQLVQEQVKEISESQLTTIFAMAKLAEGRDEDTGKHLERVRNYSRLLASWLQSHSIYKANISDQFIHNIYHASPLHDIGKVGIPDHVLLKPGPLSREEFDIMKQHTMIGAKTLEAVRDMYPKNGLISMGVQIAGQHHEKWDGSGYPNGLAGGQISLAARIMAVADVYDALRTKRVYKPAFSKEKTCGMLLESSGKHFDPVIVEAFRQLQDQFDEITISLCD